MENLKEPIDNNSQEGEQNYKEDIRPSHNTQELYNQAKEIAGELITKNKAELNLISLFPSLQKNLEEKFGPLDPEQLSAIAEIMIEKSTKPDPIEKTNATEFYSAQLSSLKEAAKAIKNNPTFANRIKKYFGKQAAVGMLALGLFLNSCTFKAVYPLQEITQLQTISGKLLEKTPRYPSFSSEEELSKYFKVQRVVELSVAEKENSDVITILYIGQIHRVPGSVIETSLKQKIVNAQKNIERLILTIKEGAKTNKVYLEGIVNDKIMQKIEEFISTLKKELNLFKNTSKDFAAFAKYYIKSIGEILATKGPTIGAYADYLFMLKFEEIDNHIARHPEEFQSEQDKAYLEEYNKIKDILSLRGIKQEIINNLYYEGSPIKLGLNEVIQILPAEKERINDEAWEAVADSTLLTSINNEYYDLAKKGIIPTEHLAQLKDELSAAYEKFNEIVYDAREMVALEKIYTDYLENKLNSGDKIMLVYGNSHKFGNEVRKFNNENKVGKGGKPLKFELIEFRPK